MTNPAVNALALQTEFGDEAMKRDVDNHILDVIRTNLLAGTLDGPLKAMAQAWFDQWATTPAFRKAVNDALIRNLQHIQHNIPY